jgi:hypothetical protein
MTNIDFGTQKGGDAIMTIKAKNGIVALRAEVGRALKRLKSYSLQGDYPWTFHENQERYYQKMEKEDLYYIVSYPAQIAVKNIIN